MLIVLQDDTTPKIGGGDVCYALTREGHTPIIFMSYQTVTGTLNPGGHPGSYNGQDAYNDMLITGGDNGNLYGICTSERWDYEGGVSLLERKP